MYTNGYNHDILKLWGANIDFQFVLDEYSTIIYVCSYMMKSEKAMGEVLKSVAKECHSDPIEQQLKKIGKAFIGHRVVGALEAVMRELSMWLMKKSRKVTFVNSNMCDDQVSLPKHEKALSEMEEDEDNVYMTSIHDRYASQPGSLEVMCLAKFAVNYEPIFDSKQVDEQTEDANDDDIEDNEDEMIRGRHNDVIVLNNNLGCMQKRWSESILHIKAFRQNTEPEKY